jgi:hypothetical protein
VIVRIVVYIAAALVLSTWAGVVGAACSQAEIERLETEVKSLDERLAAIDDELAGLTAEMERITTGIDEEKRSGDPGLNPFKRRRLEGLLRKSRAKAEEMDLFNRQRRAVATDREAAATTLRDCYNDALTTLLASLLEAVQTRHFDLARSHFESINQLEEKLRALGVNETTAGYPTISEGFIAQSMADEADAAFLYDTMQDLLDKAMRDSSRVERELQKTRESIRLKQNLIDLVNEAADGGVEGSSFFEEFGVEAVAFEIEELKKEESALTEALDRATRAIAYYRDRIVLVETILKQRREK